MELKRLKLNGSFEITLKPYEDNRGFFMRVFDDKVFSDLGIENKWVQENHSHSTQKGIIRGLHFQLPPFSETKLIRAVRGEALDVFVDLRKGSPTFGQWDSVLLSEYKHNYVLVPKGFAHGFCTLTDVCSMIYKVDNYYSPKHEIGLLWNDKKIDIDWPVKNPILSSKDEKNLSLNDFIAKYNAIEQ